MNSEGLKQYDALRRKITNRYKIAREAVIDPTKKLAEKLFAEYEEALKEAIGSRNKKAEVNTNVNAIWDKFYQAKVYVIYGNPTLDQTGRIELDAEEDLIKKFDEVYDILSRIEMTDGNPQEAKDEINKLYNFISIDRDVSRIGEINSNYANHVEKEITDQIFAEVKRAVDSKTYLFTDAQKKKVDKAFNKIAEKNEFNTKMRNLFKKKLEVEIDKDTKIDVSDNGMLKYVNEEYENYLKEIGMM